MSCQTTLSVSDLTDKYIGCPFERHGRDPVKGMDCLGWLLVVCREIHGVDLPDPVEISGVRWTVRLRDFKGHFRRITEAQVQPGDLAYDAHKDQPVMKHISIYDQDPGWWSHTNYNDGLCRVRITEWEDPDGIEFYALRPHDL
jgi:hypothetical protein